MNEKIFFPAKTGRLETFIIAPEGEVGGLALLHHPNPLHGGTANNKVIQMAARSLKNSGYLCMLPNSRGTGESEGRHDFGRGESEDFLFLLDAVRARYPQAADNVLLGGFSFGGYVAARVAARQTPQKLLLIAAAVDKYEESAPPVPDPGRTLFVHGAADEVVTLPEVLRWCAPQDLPVTVIPEAGHFFHGKLPLLARVIAEFAARK